METLYNQFSQFSDKFSFWEKRRIYKEAPEPTFNLNEYFWDEENQETKRTQLEQLLSNIPVDQEKNVSKLQVFLNQIQAKEKSLEEEYAKIWSEIEEKVRWEMVGEDYVDELQIQQEIDDRYAQEIEKKPYVKLRTDINFLNEMQLKVAQKIDQIQTVQKTTKERLHTIEPREMKQIKSREKIESKYEQLQELPKMFKITERRGMNVRTVAGAKVTTLSFGANVEIEAWKTGAELGGEIKSKYGEKRIWGKIQGTENWVALSFKNPEGGWNLEVVKQEKEVGIKSGVEGEVNPKDSLVFPEKEANSGSTVVLPQKERKKEPKSGGFMVGV